MPNLISLEWVRFVDGFEVVELHTDDFGIDTSTLDIDVDELANFGADFGMIEEDLEVSVTSRASPTVVKLVEALTQEELLEFKTQELRTAKYLLARSHVTEHYRPLDQYTGLFMEFSKIPLTPEAAQTLGW